MYQAPYRQQKLVIILKKFCPAWVTHSITLYVVYTSWHFWCHFFCIAVQFVYYIGNTSAEQVCHWCVLFVSIYNSSPHNYCAGDMLHLSRSFTPSRAQAHVQLWAVWPFMFPDSGTWGIFLPPMHGSVYTCVWGTFRVYTQIGGKGRETEVDAYRSMDWNSERKTRCLELYSLEYGMVLDIKIEVPHTRLKEMMGRML